MSKSLSSAAVLALTLLVSSVLLQAPTAHAQCTDGVSGTTYSERAANLYNCVLAAYSGSYVPPSERTNVTVDSAFLSVTGIDDKAKQMRILVHLTLEWVDERLTWNSDWNISHLSIPSGSIWNPNIEQLLSAGKFDNELSSEFVTVTPQGEAEWVRPGVISLQCFDDVNWKQFPFDQTICRASFQSLTLTEQNLGLNFRGPLESHDCQVVNLNRTTQGTVEVCPEKNFVRSLVDRFEYVDTSVEFVDNQRRGDGKIYSAIDYTIRLERSQQFYFARIVGPYFAILLLAFVALLISWDPDWRPESSFVGRDDVGKIHRIRLPGMRVRAAYGITAVLTSTSLNWIASSFVPIIGVTTWLDSFTLGTTLLVAWPLFESVLVGAFFEYRLNHGQSWAYCWRSVEKKLARHLKKGETIHTWDEQGCWERTVNRWRVLRLFLSTASQWHNQFLFKSPQMNVSGDAGDFLAARVDRKNHQMWLLKALYFEELLHPPLAGLTWSLFYIGLFSKPYSSEFETDRFSQVNFAALMVAIVFSLLFSIWLIITVLDMIGVKSTLQKQRPQHLSPDGTMIIPWEEDIVKAVYWWKPDDVKRWLACCLNTTVEEIENILSRGQNYVKGEPRADIDGIMLFTFHKELWRRLGFCQTTATIIDDALKTALVMGGPMMYKKKVLETYSNAPGSSTRLQRVNRDAWEKLSRAPPKQAKVIPVESDPEDSTDEFGEPKPGKSLMMNGHGVPGASKPRPEPSETQKRLSALPTANVPPGTSLPAPTTAQTARPNKSYTGEVLEDDEYDDEFEHDTDDYEFNGLDGRFEGHGSKPTSDV